MGRHALAIGAVCLFFLAALVGCGGSGGGSTSTSATTTTVVNAIPAITTLSPATATVGSSVTTLTVNGSGFISSSTVMWNGNARPTTFVSTTQLQATLQASDIAATGTAQVTVTSPAPGGGTSNSIAFAISNPAPIVSAVTPATITTSDNGATLSVTGTGFVPGSVIQWNGVNRTTTYISSTELRTAVTAADLTTTG